MRLCNRCKLMKAEVDFPAKNLNTCKKCKGKTSMAWRKKHPEKDKLINRKCHLARKYNLTIKQHEQMYLNQNGCCALCSKPVEYDKIDTDHNHSTAKVRGLLCRGCNIKVGWYDRLRTTIERYVA